MEQAGLPDRARPARSETADFTTIAQRGRPFVLRSTPPPTVRSRCLLTQLRGDRFLTLSLGVGLAFPDLWAAAAVTPNQVTLVGAICACPHLLFAWSLSSAMVAAFVHVLDTVAATLAALPAVAGGPYFPT